jgi:ribosomal protein L44E
MKKAFVFLLIIALVGLTFGSCEKEVVTYCPFCGQASLKEVSTYSLEDASTTLYYKCTNTKCGKEFGAGKNPL